MEIVLVEASNAFESFVGINVWTMIFAWCNLLILYLFLKKKLFKPMEDMITSRQKEVDDMYENAATAEKQAVEMKVSYEEKLNKANEESEEILKTAHRRAQLKEEEIIRDAQDEASRIYERAQEQIELEKKHALSEVKNEVSGMAIEIAGAVIGREVSEKEHSEFIDSFINSVGE